MNSKTKAKRNRPLLKNRDLTPYTRQVNADKVDRSHNGMDEQNQLLDSYIKSKGIQFVLDAIREKESRPSRVDEVQIVEKTASQIIQAIMKMLPNEIQIPSPVAAVNKNALNPKPITTDKPDMEKLKGLL